MHFILSQRLTFSLQVSLLSKNAYPLINKAKSVMTEHFFIVSNGTLHVQKKHITLRQLKGYSLSLRLALIVNHLSGLLTLFIGSMNGVLKQHTDPI